MSKERNTDFAIGAEQVFSLYKEYKIAGFNDKQAMDIIIALIRGLKQ